MGMGRGRMVSMGLERIGKELMLRASNGRVELEETGRVRSCIET
jgi:hypothetical protein